MQTLVNSAADSILWVACETNSHQGMQNAVLDTSIWCLLATRCDLVKQWDIIWPEIGKTILAIQIDMINPLYDGDWKEPAATQLNLRMGLDDKYTELLMYVVYTQFDQLEFSYSGFQTN